MKIKIVTYWPGKKLKVCIGNVRDFLNIKYNGSYSPAKELDFIKEGCTGYACNIKRDLDPDSCDLLVWIHEDEPVNYQLSILTHELTHVKQFVESNKIKKNETWPMELEAYFIGDLYREIVDIILP